MHNITLSVIIPTCPGREAKLRNLLEGIASTVVGRDRLEVVLIVDAEDEGPLRIAETLLQGFSFQGLTQRNAGPATARNRAIRAARGDWIIFFDDDALVADDTLSRHLALIDADPQSVNAHLGRVDWPPYLLDGPWRRLLATTSMLFFWDRMTPGGEYGFRHFWTTNLSVRRELVLAVDGFDERFPDAIHEDIELGWRLEKRFGTRVIAHHDTPAWHDHPLGVGDYFRREHRCGRSAGIARTINESFHDAVWGWLTDAEATRDTLRGMFTASGRELVGLLERWNAAGDHEPTADERTAIYAAHLPLKRMFFCQGYLQASFEELWEDFQQAAGANSPVERARKTVLASSGHSAS